jgi:cell wall-associated NlpC family hydrolase
MLLTQALMGERVTIYDRNGEGFAWGQLNSDGYVGWLPDRALGKPVATPTHKVTAIRTFAFPGPSIKLPPVDTLVMGATVTVIREDGTFAITRDGWYLPLPHVGTIDRHADDFVAVAEQFAGTPYLWGGKSSLGIDCSGLVQVSLNAAGTGCPRDSDMQQDSLGKALDASEIKKLQRGDLIFWKAMSRSCGAPTPSCTPTRITWPRQSKTPATRSRGSGLRAAKSWRSSGLAERYSAAAPPGAASSRNAAANSARV